MNIALLNSGGVDSAVAAHLLCEQGYRPDLYYIRIGMDDDGLTCTAEEDIELSQATARRYGLRLEVVDLQKEYWERVVEYTMEHVRRGLTPNPDVMCNKLIKFGAFEEKAGHSYDRVATGHYARLVTAPCHLEQGAFTGVEPASDGERPFPQDGKGEETGPASALWLGTAPDPVKDQTDFLAQLSGLQVRKLLFPIGHLMKEEVRRIALENRLPSARRKDSQGICFLGKINYADFVRRFLGEKEGDVIEIETGRRVGRHRGYWFHTIGQRKGLGFGGGPWFVVKKDVRKNILFVSHGYDPGTAYKQQFTVHGMHFLTADVLSGCRDMPVTFKIRHTPEFHRALLSHAGGGSYTVHAGEPIHGVAPGQFCVIYDENHHRCIGSAEITV